VGGNAMGPELVPERVHLQRSKVPHGMVLFLFVGSKDKVGFDRFGLRPGLQIVRGTCQNKMEEARRKRARKCRWHRAKLEDGGNGRKQRPRTPLRQQAPRSVATRHEVSA